MEEALLILQRMGSPDAQAEVEAMRAALAEEGADAKTTLFTKRHQFPIYLAITIALFNQLSGINAILYYLNDIFRNAGFGQMSSNLQAVAIGLANLLATLLGISLIDRLGRKTLLLIGAAGCGMCLAGVAFLFHAGTHQTLLLPLLVAFIVFFAISQGAVIWVYLSEVFPTNVRSKGQALGCSTHWIMNGLITLAFPVVARHSKALPFGFFAAMMLVQLVVVAGTYPETKGLSLEALQAELSKPTS